MPGKKQFTDEEARERKNARQREYYHQHSEQIKKYAMEYANNNNKKVTIALHTTIDADVMEKLESVPSKRGYILDLIRRDIAENGI